MDGQFTVYRLAAVEMCHYCIIRDTRICPSTSIHSQAGMFDGRPARARRCVACGNGPEDLVLQANPQVKLDRSVLSNR
jgi:hypothetical protein